MRKSKAPTNPFSIPEFIANEIGNAAYKVVSVDAIDGLVTCTVYDPLDLTVEGHGSVVELAIDEPWVSVQLAPQLFKAA